MGVSGSRAGAHRASTRSALRRKKDAKHSLTELPYYHPHVNNSEEALKALDGCPSGSFILRNCSGKHEGFCAVSVVVGGDKDRTLRHFDIRLRDGCFCFERKKLFKTLADLVAHYGKNDVPNSRSVTGIRLLRPHLKQLRSPAPLPQLPLAAGSQEEAAAAMKNGEYSYATHKDMTDDLISNLEQQQLLLQMQLQSSRRGTRTTSASSNGGGSTYGKCVCGIRLVDGALPGGWTVHQNVKEHVVFFKDLTGTSCWDLPADINQLLTDQQRAFIKHLRDKLSIAKGSADGDL